MRPARTLARLQAVFGFYRHELPCIHHLREELGDLLLELRAVLLEIAHEEIHERLRGGPDAVVCAGSARQFANEKNQGAQAGAKVAFLRVVALLADNLVVFAFEFAGVDEVRGNLVIDEIARNHGAEGVGSRLLRRLEDDLQLGAQLRFRPGVVGVAKHFLPEPPAGGQKRIVGHEEGFVLVICCEPGVLKLARNLAVVVPHALLDGRFVLGFLMQNRLADDALDIGIGKLDAHGKTRLEPLKAGGGIEGRLTGAHEEQPLVQLGAAVLGDFLHIHRALDFLADELLDFVHDEQSAGQLSFVTKHLPDEVERLSHGGGGNIREPCTDGFLCVLHRPVFRVGADEGLREGDRVVHIAHFLRECAFALLERLLNLGLQPG